ncbi:MAG: MarR family winged helix-turn-helix transcriptional regulator [Paracoccaceae bacterium]|nr:MarR family winged helix-turn-helix transcriptional regulator [Paracoccaceae bacterium]
MSKPINDPLAVSLFSEISAIDHLFKIQLSKSLPIGMKLSQFAILNHIATLDGEKTPVQLARSFNLTKGAITNTLTKLSAMGYIHTRPDWDDARSKLISISTAGKNARNRAVDSIEPILGNLMKVMGAEKTKSIIPFLRDLRIILNNLEN